MDEKFSINFSEFLLNPKEIITTENLLQSKSINLSKGIYRNNKILVHTFPILAFSVHDLIKFLRFIIFNSNPVCDLFLKTFGIGFDSSTIFVAYSNDDELKPIIISNLSNEDKNTILLKSLKVIKILNHNNFEYVNLKLTSIFNDSNNNVKFGCFLPFPMITLSPEDIKLTTFREKLDIYLFGLLSIELYSNKAQTYILNEFWKFNEKDHPYIPSNMPFPDLIQECINLAPSLRPSLDILCQSILDSDFNQNVVNINPKELECQILSDEEFFSICKIISDNIGNQFDCDTVVFFDILIGSYLIEQKSIQLAISLFQKSLSSPISMNNLALLMNKKDPLYALQLFTEAAERYNYVIAQKNLAMIYKKGIAKKPPEVGYIIEKNEQQSFKYLKMAADQGYVECIGDVMQILRKQKDVNYRSYAFQGAYKGEQRCLILVQTLFDEGYGGVEENENASRYLAKQIAFMGNKIMLNYYAEWLNYDGYHQDAFNLIYRNAQNGNAPAQIKLSLFYLQGNGVEKNEVEAAKWMKKASDQNLVEAMFNYAAMLRDGIGVPKDENQANALCIQASKMRTMKIVQHSQVEDIDGEFHLPTPYRYFLYESSDEEESD